MFIIFTPIPKDGGYPIKHLVPGIELASLGSRLAAKLIDAVLIVLAGATSILGISLDENGYSGLVVMGVAFLALLIAQIYLLTKEGQTVGKKLLQIQIVNYEDNTNGGFVPNVLMRSFVNYLLGMLPLYSLIDILFIFSSDRRCIHDRLAGTKVIKIL